MPERREEGDDLLDLYLETHHAYCPSCRTPLRELAGRRCPTCRQRLVLGVALEHPNVASYLVGLAAMLIAAALNAYLAFHFSLEVARHGLTDDRPAFLFLAAANALVTTLALALWMALGRRFRRQGVVRRWVVVVLLWILPVGSFIATLQLLT